MDNSYQQTVDMTVTIADHAADAEDGAEVEEAHLTCNTVIRLNGTHTMRGEQETYFVPSLPDYLYLGGVPYDTMVYDDTDLRVPTGGFRGCIASLVIDNTEMEIFSGAVGGQDVIECGKLSLESFAF